MSDLPTILLKGENVTIRGTVEDPSGIGEVIISADGIGQIDTAEDLSSYSFDLDVDTSDINPGSVSFFVEAKDSLGNWNEVEISMRLVTLTTDTDGDRMPDWWEELFGLDADRRDGTEDLDGDGYTNFEEYLGMDGRSGNDDYSDPNDISSIPVKGGSDNNAEGIPSMVILIILLALIAALVLFIIIRFTKRG